MALGKRKVILIKNFFSIQSSSDYLFLIVD